MTRLRLSVHSIQVLLFLFYPLYFFSGVSAVSLFAQGEPEPNSDYEIDDDPAARIAYEQLLLADPATGVIPNGIRKRELAFAATIPTREEFGACGKGGEVLALVTDWRAQGPPNQGGRTRALAIDRTDESVILAGGVSGGMWRSQDTGKHWMRVTDPDQLQSVTCVAQDPRPGGGNVWYYGTGEWRGSAFPVTGAGLFKSTDGGLSWFSLSAVKNGPPQSADSMLRYVYNIVVDPSSPDREKLYVACYGGILCSVDGGESWKIVLGGFDNHAQSTDVAITGSGTVYATLSSDGSRVRGIWRSEDGENWTEITPPNFPTYYDRISIGIAPFSPDVVYFFGSMYSSGNAHGLWYHRYRGSLPGLWEDRSSGLPSNIETYSSYCQVVRVSPKSEDIVFVGGVLLYRSTNGFRDQSATLTLTSGLHPDQHEVLFFPSNSARMLAGHDGGVSFTQNGMGPSVNWEFRNDGYVTTQFYTAAVDHITEGNCTVIGGAQDNGTWLLRNACDSAGWNSIGPGDGGYCAMADSGRTYYISYQYGAMQRLLLRNDGTIFHRENFGPTKGSGFAFINPFALDPADDRIMYVPGGRNLWRAADLPAGLSNWTKLDGAVIPAVDGGITALGLSRDNPPHRLYYGTLNGRLYRLERADSGNPVRQDLFAFPPSGGVVSSIAVDPHNGNHVLVGISSYNVRSLFYTSDGGENWSDVSGNLEEYPDGSGAGPSVRSVAMVRVGGLTLYLAGTTAGLYSTTRLEGEATHWVLEGAGAMGKVWINMIAVRESDGFVAAATHGCGIYCAHFRSSAEEVTASLSPGLLDFGEVAVGRMGLDTVLLANQSGSSRSLRGHAEAPRKPFSLLPGFAETEAAPGESGKIIVAFTPDSVGSYSDSLVINHDATVPSEPLVLYLSGRGIESAGEVREEKEPAARGTLRCSPNPFSKNATLDFDIAKGGNVRVVVLAIDGAEVAQLHEGRMEAGAHNLTWHPTDQAAGTYYIRVEANGERQTLRVVLER